MHINFTNSFLLLITPIAPLVGLTTSPLLAATLGSSEARVEIGNFSHDPSEVLILAETYAETFASNGGVTAEAVNDLFVVDSPFYADNSSFSRTNGNGSEYSGIAQSTAAVVGYNFRVNSGETFSFNFNAGLNLATSIDNP